MPPPETSIHTKGASSMSINRTTKIVFTVFIFIAIT